MANENQVAKSSALTELLSLAEPVGPSVEDTKVDGLADPVLRYATRNKQTVTLNFDPNFESQAREAARLNSTILKAQEAFKKFQEAVRRYGAEKKDAYNAAFKSDVVTVNVPYHFDDANGQNVVGHIQVVCSNKYNVAKEAILKLEKDLGDKFSKLFKKDVKKVLKPNSEALFKQILVDLGVPEEKLAGTMAVLFDDDVSVGTTEEYENVLKTLPEDVQVVLKQNVTRSQPGLKFLAK